MTLITNQQQYSISSHDFIWSQLQGTPFPSSPRFDLVLAYVSITLEHQHAIINLVGLKLVGSAFALLRPQVETAFRGLWVNLIATDEQVTAIAKDGKEPFPKFRDMASELDTRYGLDGWCSSIAAQWGALNGFTHSGLEQLGHRFRDDGNIFPTYPDEMIASLLQLSATISIGLLPAIYRNMGLQDKASALEQWLDDYVKPKPDVVPTPALS